MTAFLNLPFMKRASGFFSHLAALRERARNRKV